MMLNLVYEDFSVRPLTMDDAELMLNWRNQDAVRQGMFHSRRLTLEEHVPWLQNRLALDTCFYYMLEYKGRATGIFGIDIVPDQGIGEWVYFFGPRYDGLPHGAGAAGEFLAIETFFNQHQIRRLWGRTLKSNTRVWRMHERFGFSIEGAMREHVAKDGELIDVLIVGLLEREWRGASEGQFRCIFRAGIR